MTEERPEPDRAPISWDALAAELAATREEAGRRGDDDPATWDAVAAALASRVADRPVTEEPVPALPPEAELPPAVPVPLPVSEPDPDPEPLELLDPVALRGGLEALLFVVDDPVDEETLAAALRCPEEQVREGLVALAAGYDER